MIGGPSNPWAITGGDRQSHGGGLGDFNGDLIREGLPDHALARAASAAQRVIKGAKSKLIRQFQARDGDEFARGLRMPSFKAKHEGGLASEILSVGIAEGQEDVHAVEVGGKGRSHQRGVAIAMVPAKPIRPLFILSTGHEERAVMVESEQAFAIHFI